MPTPVEKRCSKCGETKALDEFYKHPRAFAGRQSKCKPCQRRATQEWRDGRGAELVRRQNHEARHLWQYGITRADRAEIFTAQGGRCSICRDQLEMHPQARDHVGSLYPFAEIAGYLDHCHTTNTVRALLCKHCNLMLGYARDEPARLQAGINYLEKHHGRRQG